DRVEFHRRHEQEVPSGDRMRPAEFVAALVDQACLRPRAYEHNLVAEEARPKHARRERMPVADVWNGFRSAVVFDPAFLHRINAPGFLCCSQQTGRFPSEARMTVELIAVKVLPHDEVTVGAELSGAPTG